MRIIGPIALKNGNEFLYPHSGVELNALESRRRSRVIKYQEGKRNMIPVLWINLRCFYFNLLASVGGYFGGKVQDAVTQFRFDPVRIDCFRELN